VEPGFPIETGAELNCTPNGSLRYSHQGHLLYDILHRRQELPPASPASPREKISANGCATITTSLRSGRATSRPSLATVIRSRRSNSYPSRASIFLAWIFVPERRAPDRSAILYFSERGGVDYDTMASSPGVIEEFDGSRQPINCGRRARHR
jgi:hypothetical protein